MVFLQTFFTCILFIFTLHHTQTASFNHFTGIKDHRKQWPQHRLFIQQNIPNSPYVPTQRKSISSNLMPTLNTYNTLPTKTNLQWQKELFNNLEEQRRILENFRDQKAKECRSFTHHMLKETETRYFAVYDSINNIQPYPSDNLTLDRAFFNKAQEEAPYFILEFSKDASIANTILLYNPANKTIIAKSNTFNDTTWKIISGLKTRRICLIPTQNQPSVPSPKIDAEKIYRLNDGTFIILYPKSHMLHVHADGTQKECAIDPERAMKISPANLKKFDIKSLKENKKTWKILSDLLSQGEKVYRPE